MRLLHTATLVSLQMLELPKGTSTIGPAADESTILYGPPLSPHGVPSRLGRNHIDHRAPRCSNIISLLSPGHEGGWLCLCHLHFDNETSGRNVEKSGWPEFSYITERSGPISEAASYVVSPGLHMPGRNLFSPDGLRQKRTRFSGNGFIQYLL